MLYHRSIGFPANLRLPNGMYCLIYTRHARNAAKQDRYGNLLASLPKFLDTASAKPIEVSTDSRGHAIKILYRVHLTNAIDLAIVVLPQRSGWIVKTVFGNDRNDHHSTLRSGVYTKP